MVCLSGFYFQNNKAQSTNNAGRPRIVLHDNSVRTLFLAVASRTGSFDKKIPCMHVSMAMEWWPIACEKKGPCNCSLTFNLVHIHYSNIGVEKYTKIFNIQRM
jgi:hypothetical protein